MEKIGAAIGDFDPAIRVYPANVNHESLTAIATADFVLAVEPVGIAQATHDTSVPAMGVDALRSYVPGDGLFTGITGASVPIGVLDTGLNINHVDIESNRREHLRGELSLRLAIRWPRRTICGLTLVATVPM